MTYFNPVEVVFGSSVRSQIVDECANKVPLLICSSGAYRRYRNDATLRALLRCEPCVFESGFESNPSLSDIIRISEKFKSAPPNLIIGMGGGSAMDVAKILSVTIPALAESIHVNQLLVDSSLFAEFEKIDCVLVPTTAGTGSEVTPFATVWDYAANKKKSLSHHKMYAKKAFVDPDFLSHLPLEVSISTGLDALNQALESLWNKNASELSRPLARQAAILTLQALPMVNEIGEDADVRSKLALGSLFAGLAISQTRTSICHSISYPLTLKYGIDHGLACAFSMLEVFKYNVDYVCDDLDYVGSMIKKDVFTALHDIIQQFRVPSKLANLLPDETMFFQSIEDFITEGRFDNNIRYCTRTDLIEIITESYKFMKRPI